VARIGTSLLGAAAPWLLCVFFCLFLSFSVSFRFTPVGTTRESRKLVYYPKITGPGGWPRTVGHDLKFESPGGNDAGSSFSASRRDATRRMSATELVCASPSQQRLRRSSVAAALRAASAPSQQHQLRPACCVADATRRMTNERDGAGLRISVAAATPSQLRRSSAARTMSGRRGSRKSLSSPLPLGKFAKNRGTPHKPCDFNIILPKELRPLPCQGIFFLG